MLFFHRVILLLGILCLCSAGAIALDSNQPTIGYLYPAGGQQGTTVQIEVGGQFLRGASNIYISGEGVAAKVIDAFPLRRNLNGDQRRAIQKKLTEARDRRIAELPPKERASLYPNGKLPKKPAQAAGPSKTPDKDSAPPVKLPKNPMLNNLEDKSLAELVQVAYELFFPRNKLQPNRQLAEGVLIEVTIAADAEPGLRELRLQSRNGLTNPVVFQVGTLPETSEMEPNDKNIPVIINSFFRSLNVAEAQKLIEPKPLEFPIVLNGRIMPGDIDRFRFRAKAGQNLVIETYARSLIPYLADAVPGWFQATVAMYNAAGTEIAYADDYRFNPDPVLFYEIPRDGYYELEIRDSIYRGREDFVYRIVVGQQPFITQMRPLGGKEGVTTTASIDGRNLSQKQITLDTSPGQHTIRRARYRDGKSISNTVPYAVDTLPECTETESNDTIKTAQKINLPKIVNGQIQKAGDIDVFRLTGHAGDKIAAEVFARRLNSPLDSLLRLTDASGDVLKWNDDYVETEQYLFIDTLGLQTHHADSYLIAELPKDGTYYVHLSDSAHHGGSAHSYRLRIARAEGDFGLRAAPSSLAAPEGGVVPISVYVLRKDGFEGPVDLFVKNHETGFTLSGGTIPAGKDSVHMTLTIPNKPGSRGLVVLELEGRAQIGNKTIVRPVVPADDTMQAFLYRHLVPAQQLMVLIQKYRWRMPSVERVGSGPVQIPAGGSVQVRLKTQRRPFLKEIDLELYNPPAGITLQEATVIPEGLAFVLKTDKDVFKTEVSDNLIIQAFRNYTPKPKEGQPAPKRRRDSMGLIPAIPIQVVLNPKTEEQDTKPDNKPVDVATKQT